MRERTMVIRAAEGLHARPAAELVHLATAHAGRVRIRSTSSDWVDGESIIAVMMLSLDRGDTVIIAADGDAADAFLDTAERLLGA